MALFSYNNSLTHGFYMFGMLLVCRSSGRFKKRSLSKELKSRPGYGQSATSQANQLLNIPANEVKLDLFGIFPELLKWALKADKFLRGSWRTSFGVMGE